MRRDRAAPLHHCILIESATRPGYSAWRHAVSQLSLGEQGWINSVNIINLSHVSFNTLCIE